MRMSSKLSGSATLKKDTESGEPRLTLDDKSDLSKWLKVLHMNYSGKPRRGWGDFPINALFSAPDSRDYRSVSSKTVRPWKRDQLKLPRINSTGSATDFQADFFGRSLFRVLEDLREPEDLRSGSEDLEGKLELRLETRQDLRVFHILQLPGSQPKKPAPFAHVGEWTDSPQSALALRHAVVATAWNDSALRDQLIKWITNRYHRMAQEAGAKVRGKGGDVPFLFHFAPFVFYNLYITSDIKPLDQGWRFEKLELQVQLPHLTYAADEANIVTRLPSIMTIECDAKIKNETKTYVTKVLNTPSGNKEQERENSEEEHHQGLHNEIDTETLLVASPHLRTAVEEIAELWQDRTLRTVLFIAPPGAGKEVMVKFLHAGSTLFNERFVGTSGEDEWKCQMRAVATPLAEASLVGLSDAEVRSTIFGRIDERDKPPSHPHHDFGKEDGKHRIWRDGLVLGARGTTLFLDEIDKGKEEILSSLLRFVEDDEVQPQGAHTPFRLGDLEKARKPSANGGKHFDKLKARLVFAGSLPRRQMLALEPPDFWTRIQRIIEILHPFEIHSVEERYRCLQEYFALFLYRAIEKDYKYKKGDKWGALNKLLKSIVGTEHHAYEDLKEAADLLAVPAKNRDYPFLYVDQSTIERISGHVALFLLQFPASQLSVRNLKSIVKRLDYRIRIFIERGVDLQGIRAAGVHHNDQKPNPHRYCDQHWIWQNLHEITLAVVR